jgi:hypothetical protein
MSRRVMRMQAHYELLTDNLMDLSHVEFIHADTFHSDGAIFKGVHQVAQQADGGIRSDWRMDNVTAGFNNCALSADTRVDKWLNMCWYAPASMWLEVGMTLAGGDPGAPAVEGAAGGREPVAPECPLPVCRLRQCLALRPRRGHRAFIQ